MSLQVTRMPRPLSAAMAWEHFSCNILGVWSKRRQTKTAIGQNGDTKMATKSKQRQKLYVVKLLMKRTVMIYSLCTRLSYLKRRVIYVVCVELL